MNSMKRALVTVILAGAALTVCGTAQAADQPGKHYFDSTNYVNFMLESMPSAPIPGLSDDLKVGLAQSIMKIIAERIGL
ncbi:hypothetical protein ACIQJT_40775 [Streptomyces sp. NPDC091972]|uniref:hypothetical protein n=1 Tax=Streptomyces sp. NPDC091972 TaxID=3366007 RepID=UPI00381DC924